MQLIKRRNNGWDPFSLLEQWRPDLYPAENDLNRRYREWGGDFTPQLDVSEAKDSFHVTAEIPGVNKEDVDISIQNNTLTIRGKKTEETNKEDKKQHFSERFYGSFVRSLEFPVDINTGNVKASYKDGLLKLVIPKSENATPKQIKIDVQ